MSVREFFLKTGFTSANFNCSGKVLLLIEWLILTKKNFKKISAFYLMIMVGISRSWEAFVISSSRVTFLTSSRLTFSKENLQPEFSFFILRMLGCFSKVLIAFSIGSLCSLEISQRLMLRPSTIPSNKTERFPQFRFLWKKLYHKYIGVVIFLHIYCIIIETNVLLRKS